MAAQSAPRPRCSTELLGIVVSCVGVAALLLGLAPVLFQCPLGLLLLGFGALGAIGHVVATLRAGRSAGRALIELLLVAALTFGLLYGVIWY